MERITGQLEESIEVALLTTPVDVIVMGPGLSDTSPAAALRRDIIGAAHDFGVIIEPEHEQLIAAASAKFREGHSLTAYEMYLVDQSHLVVLIPASPGSLCELGLFASFEQFARKLLVLVSREYREESSYIADGPLTIATQYKAEVRYIDYDDFEAARNLVRTRIQQIRVTRSLERFKGAPSR